MVTVRTEVSKRCLVPRIAFRSGDGGEPGGLGEDVRVAGNQTMRDGAHTADQRLVVADRDPGAQTSGVEGLGRAGQRDRAHRQFVGEAGKRDIRAVEDEFIVQFVAD